MIGARCAKAEEALTDPNAPNKEIYANAAALALTEFSNVLKKEGLK
jgi:hypothetical protein